MPRTPTLFQRKAPCARTVQLLLTTYRTKLSGIYHAIHDNACCSNSLAALANDWTNVRCNWAPTFKGTNGQIPGCCALPEVVNDTAVAVNQGGKAQGAVCAYLGNLALESKNSSNCARHRRRPPPAPTTMNTANWIPLTCS